MRDEQVKGVHDYAASPGSRGNNGSAKTLVVQAIDKQTKTLAHGIRRTKEELARFEQQYAMSSTEFEQRFQSGNLPESEDFIDWWMELEALHLLTAKYQALHEVQID